MFDLSLENVGECLLLHEVELIVTDLYQMHGYKQTILMELFLLKTTEPVENDSSAHLFTEPLS